MDVDVVIVGAGPTGLIAAHLLGQAGISTLVLERNPSLSGIPRAITLDDEGLRICQALGLAQDLADILLRDVAADYITSNGHTLGHVEPQQQRNGHPLISTLHQPAFEALLLAHLRHLPSVKLRFAHTVQAIEQDEQQVTLHVHTPDNGLCTLTCSYLLACDGGKSTIRQELDILLRPISLHDLFPARLGQGQAWDKSELPFHQQNLRTPSLHMIEFSKATDKGQRWLVVDCLQHPSTSDTPSIKPTITFFCNPARPAVTVPAPQGRQRWEFMLLPGEDAENLLHGDVICKLIEQARQTQRFISGQALITEQPNIIRATIYTFHTLLAEHFSVGRIFLLGDAAHLMPPFGGQGMNSGLRDAFNLCWKLKLVLQAKANPLSLETYERERRPHVAQMMLFSSLLGKIIMPTRLMLASLRDLFFRSISALPPVRNAITEMHVKPQPRYTSGLLLPPSTQAAKRLVGVFIPQPPVLTPSGDYLPLDDALEHGFSLVRLYEKPDNAFAEVQHEFWHTLDIRFICIQPHMPDSLSPRHALQSLRRNHHLWRPFRRTAQTLTPSTISLTEPDSHPPLQQPHPIPITTVLDITGRWQAWVHNNQDLFVLVRPDRYVLAAFWSEQVADVVGSLQRRFSP